MKYRTGQCQQCGAPAPRHYVTTTRYVYAAFCSRECARAAVREANR